MAKSLVKSEKLSFEDAMEKLETTVQQMESQELPLEQIIEKYEEGIKLVAFCGEKLKAAEKKIELLTKAKNGDVKISTLDSKSEDAIDEDDKSGESSLF